MIKISKKPIIVIAGPTAVGKTSLSIMLAKKLDTSVVSCDSMQVYKLMDIGTAKPSPEERMGVTHYMIDEYYPDEELSVYKFAKKAKEYIKKIHLRGKIPVLVGGTGLYIDTVVNSVKLTETPISESFRADALSMAKKYGNEYLHDKLLKIDPESADKIHPNNVNRVIRALEIYHTSGITMTEQIKNSKAEREYNAFYIGLTTNRETLYERINKRVDLMLEAGLLDEVKSLMNLGYADAKTSSKAIGYKELYAYYNGDLSYDDAIILIKQNSRRYAKRQLTWFNANKDIKWFDTSKINNFDFLTETLQSENFFDIIN